MNPFPRQCEIFTPKNFEDTVIGLSLEPKVITRCPDQWVGDVECFNHGFEYLDEGNKGFNKRLNLVNSLMSIPMKRIVLVIESPHIYEFEFCHVSNESKAIGPANRATGYNIRNYINVPTREFLKLNFVNSQDVFALIIMNSVSYQCSLGKKLGGPKNIASRKDRDNVFRACWVAAKQDFCSRLTSYLTNETLVINACTKGQHKVGSGCQWLRDMVDDAIVECGVQTERYIRRCHPASLPNWRSGNSW